MFIPAVSQTPPVQSPPSQDNNNKTNKKQNHQTKNAKDYSIFTMVCAWYDVSLVR